MRAYPAYKPSGVEWLGDVPEGWEITPIKRLGHVINGYPFDSALFDANEGMPLLRIRDLNKFETEARYKGPEVEGALVTSSDVLIGMDGDFNVGRWLGDGPALLNQRMCCVRTPNDHLTRYVEYCLPVPLKRINDVTYSTTVKHLSSFQVEKISVALPPTQSEVAGIVAFLDREVGKIDALVAEQRQLMALLAEKRQAVISHAVTQGLNPHAPRKPSGIDWLGDVPVGWDVVQLRRIVDERRHVTYGIVQPGEPDPEGRYMVRGQDYSFGWADPTSIFRVSAAVEEPYKRARLKPGDLVLTIVGAGTGNVAIVPEHLDGANITQTTARIAPKREEVLPQYLARLLESYVGKTQVRLFQKGAAQPGLNLEHLVAFQFPIPPMTVQLDILAYLDSRLESFDALTETASTAIALLQERRAALISAAVTGKIDLRDLTP